MYFEDNLYASPSYGRTGSEIYLNNVVKAPFSGALEVKEANLLCRLTGLIDEGGNPVGLPDALSLNVLDGEIDPDNGDLAALLIGGEGRALQWGIAAGERGLILTYTLTEADSGNIVIDAGAIRQALVEGNSPAKEDVLALWLETGAEDLSPLTRAKVGVIGVFTDNQGVDALDPFADGAVSRWDFGE